MHKPSYIGKNHPSFKTIYNGINPNNSSGIQWFSHLDIATKYQYLTGNASSIPTGRFFGTITDADLYWYPSFTYVPHPLWFRESWVVLDSGGEIVCFCCARSLMDFWLGWAQPKEYLAAAERAALFIRSKLYSEKSKRLTRSFRMGPSQAPGFLDDYAFLIAGLLDLFEYGGDLKWLQWALELQAAQVPTSQLSFFIFFFVFGGQSIHNFWANKLTWTTLRSQRDMSGDWKCDTLRRYKEHCEVNFFNTLRRLA